MWAGKNSELATGLSRRRTSPLSFGFHAQFRASPLPEGGRRVEIELRHRLSGGIRTPHQATRNGRGGDFQCDGQLAEGNAVAAFGHGVKLYPCTIALQ